MKKLLTLATAAVIFTGCQHLANLPLGGTGTNGTTNGTNTIETITDILGVVLGTNKMNKRSIIGDWKYYRPGLAFESENLLSKAGGIMAADQAKAKLQSGYQSLGINANNTYFSFKEDQSFVGKIDGLPVSGTYMLDESTGKVALKMLLGTYNATVRTSGTGGMSLLFESTKLLKLLQTLAAFSGNTGLQAIGELSKTYKGMLIGFDLN